MPVDERSFHERKYRAIILTRLGYDARTVALACGFRDDDVKKWKYESARDEWCGVAEVSTNWERNADRIGLAILEIVAGRHHHVPLACERAAVAQHDFARWAVVRLAGAPPLTAKEKADLVENVFREAGFGD